MRSIVRAALLAGTVMLGAGPAAMLTTPACAQTDVHVGFDSFHDQLAPYGSWLYSDRWGMVWQPGDVPGDFRPYDTGGHWAYTDEYGWTWVSDYEWGAIAFHYGRWVNDPDDGWLWLPGYTWAPAWVIWRRNDQYVGWMPMPPNRSFLEGNGISVSLGAGGGAISFNWNDEPDYGYRHWYGSDYGERRFASNWVFVGYGHIGDHDYGRYAVHDPGQVVNIIRQTRTVVNYSVVDNHVVNKGIDVHRVDQLGHRPIAVVQARQVLRHPDLVASIDTGRRAREQARIIAPVGRGIANSAPPPPPQVVQKLSVNLTRYHHTGPAAAHLFTKADVEKPDVVSRFHGKTPAATTGQGGAMTHGGNAIENAHMQVHEKETTGKGGNESGTTTAMQVHRGVMQLNGPAGGTENGSNATGAGSGGGTKAVETMSRMHGAIHGGTAGASGGTGAGAELEHHYHEMKGHVPGTQTGAEANAAHAAGKRNAPVPPPGEEKGKGKNKRNDENGPH